ncbi:acyl-CoA-binding protein isoform X1 [Amborella trichopoda]|uniref:acyl-CoA-binding protein isoform X1 n=1 Tax=Amborella trichopoda TaxID=13333 RepID=UPI0009C081FC|nr:acyl-CoA-binding protein isoform X1 [Amborella trichopoda]|eukprot:XP_020526208.1 acyl-CoA-binding protein isoform X1 [Amborella trichopoda]
MGLQEEFEEYAEKATSLPPSTKDADKLILYGLYKQATAGPVNTRGLMRFSDCGIGRPGIFSPKERAKWDAWKAVDGKSKEEAMGDYITKVKQLQEAAA